MRIIHRIILAFWAFSDCYALADSADQEGDARRHFEAGARGYQSGNYDFAIAEYKAALQLLPSPSLIFNLAQAYRRKGDKRHASEYYKRYIELAPTGEGAQESKVYLAALGLELADEQPQPPVAPPTNATPVFMPSVYPIRTQPSLLLAICAEDDKSWTYCDQRGKRFGENDFIRRYHSVTGSNALDHYIESPANKTGLIVVGTISAALLIAGIASFALFEQCQPYINGHCHNGYVYPPSNVSAPEGSAPTDTQVPLVVIGVSLALTTVIGWPLAVKQSKSHHRIAQSDAQRYVDGYNQAVQVRPAIVAPTF